MENKKYNKVMERVEVTPEMRARILENIEKADVSPVKRKAVIKLPVIIAAAAALLIVSFGIYGIMTSGKYTATMKDGIADNSPVKKSAGLKVEVDGGETVAEAYEDEDLITGAATDENIREPGTDQTHSLSLDDKGKNTFNGITGGVPDIKTLFSRVSSIEYKTDEGISVTVTDKDKVSSFIQILTKEYEKTEDEIPAEASEYDLYITGEQSIKISLKVYGDRFSVFNTTYRSTVSDLESELKTLVLKEDQ